MGIEKVQKDHTWPNNFPAKAIWWRAAEWAVSTALRRLGSVSLPPCLPVVLDRADWAFSARFVKAFNEKKDYD